MRFFTLIAAFLLFAVAPVNAKVIYPLTVRDSIGRDVTIPAEPKAVLLGSDFNMIAVSLVHPDPISIIAGWSSDMQVDNPEIYASFKAKFPEIDKVAIIGAGGSISLEAMLLVKADLAILANWQADTETGRQAMTYLEETGVPVIVVNFNTDALNSTAENMRLLGRVLNREEQANAFADFYDARVKRIRDRVARQPEPGPSVLMNAFPDPEKCCYAYGTGGLGAFIALTGSRNIAEGLPAGGGMMSSEFIIAANPEVYIATASPGGTYSSFSVGPGVSPQEARETLRRAVANPFLANSQAAKDKRVHGLWNFFNAVPLNILAAEAFARWLRPNVFADIDPEDTLKEINERFAAVPFSGTYWISLEQN